MILCDTNILIELYKNNTAIIQELRQIGIHQLAISVITRAELYYGAINKNELNRIQQLCIEENLKIEAVNQMIADYKFSGKEPLRETVLSACNEKPKLLERKKIFARVVSKLLDIINKFDDAAI